MESAGIKGRETSRVVNIWHELETQSRGSSANSVSRAEREGSNPDFSRKSAKILEMAGGIVNKSILTSAVNYKSHGINKIYIPARS